MTKLTKFDRRGYKPRERILAVTNKTLLIIQKTDKNIKMKDRLPLKHVTCLQMTSGMDNFLLIKVSEQLEKSKVRSIILVSYYSTPKTLRNSITIIYIIL